MSKLAIASNNTPNVSQSSGANALLSLIASQPQAGDAGTSTANPFKALLQQLNQDGSNQTSLTPQQLSELLAKQPLGTSAAGTDASQLQIKIKTLLAENSTNAPDTAANGDAPSAALIAEIAGLMQKFPALQQLFTGNVDQQQLQSISDALTKGGTNPDFSGLQLSDDLKSQLQILAQDPKASAAFEDVAAQMTANPNLANAIPQALQNFAALVNQNNLNGGLMKVATQSQNTPAASDNSAEVATNDKTSSGKARPQGLLKSTSGDQQAAVDASKATVAAAAADNQTDTSSGALQTNVPSANKFVAADDAAPTTTQSFFTVAANTAGPQNLTADQTNALMLNGKSNVSIGGVADAAYAAQQLSSNTANTSPAAMQVAIQLQRNAQANTNNNFTMQLYPEELGRIDVSLKFVGNKTQVKISADKQETLDSLKQDSGTLTRALQSAGLQTDAGSLEFSLGNSSQQSASQSQKNNSGNDQFGTLLASNPTDETSITPASSSQWMTLGTGRVDVKL